MKKLFTIFLVFFITGCDILKKSQKTKTDTDFSETITEQTVRKGDTVSFSVPVPIFKDTTIYRYNTVTGTNLRLNYDQSGAVDIDCVSGEINSLRTEVRTLLENKTEKQKETEHNFDSSVILYGFLGLGILLIIGFLYLGYFLNKQSKLVQKALGTL